MQPARNPEVDQPRLLKAGDYPDVEECLAAQPGEQFVLVCGLTGCGGGDRDKLFGGKCSGEIDKFPADKAGAVYSIRLYLLVVKLTFPEAHLLFLAGKDGIGVVGIEPDDEHPNGVRADIDKCDNAPGRSYFF